MPRKTTTTKSAKTTRAPKTLPAKTSEKKKSIFSSFSNIKPRSLIIPVVLILGLILVGLLKNQFVAATVNGEQITRLELINELENAEGQRVLQTLVTQKLIEQEAKKRGLAVSSEEIDQEIAKIEESITAQGQNLDDLLAIQNFTRQQLREQLENQLLLQKMIDEEAVAVTDEEINQYIEQNQQSFPEGTDVEELRGEISEQLKQQKLNTEVQKLLTQIQSEAEIDILLNK